MAGVGFSPDGRTLWALSTGTLRMEERDGGKGQKRMTRVLRYEIVGDPFFEARKPPLTAADLQNPKPPRPATPRGRLLLWDVATGKTVATSLPDDLQVLAVSPDMRRVLTAKRQENYWPPRATIQVWDLAAKKPVAKAVELSDAVRLARFSPDGKLAVTAGERGIAFWNTETGALVDYTAYAILGEGAYLVQLAFSADGRYLALVSDHADGRAAPAFAPRLPGGRIHSGRLRLFRLEAGKVESVAVGLRVHSQSALAVGPEGRMLLLTSPADGLADPKVMLWDRAAGRAMATLDMPATLVYAAFSADGTRLLTVARAGSAVHSPGVIQLWDASTARPLRPPLLLRGPAVVTAPSADGKRLITAGGADTSGASQQWEFDRVQDLVGHSSAGAMGEAQLWDLAAGRPLGRPIRHPDEVLAAAFSPDGKWVATGCMDGAVRLRDLQPSRSIAPLVELKGVVACSSDGRRALVRGADESVLLHDTATGKSCGEPVRFTAKDTGIVLSPNGRTVLIAHSGTTAQLWDGVTGKTIGALLSHNGPVTGFGFRGDGRTAVTDSPLNGKTFRSRWDAATGRALGLQPSSAGMLEIASSDDGRVLLVSPPGLRTVAWSLDAASGQMLGKSMQHNGVVIGGLFSRDGQTLLTVGGRSGSWEEARLWKVATGELLGQPLQHSGRIRFPAFSMDGKAVLTGSEDGTAQLWAADTGRPLGPPMQHGAMVLVVAISPDNKLIATGGADGTVRLWHLPTKKPIGPPFLHPAAVQFLRFGQDSRALTARSNDGTVRVWEIPAAISGSIEQIRLFVQVTTGMETDGDVARLLDDSELGRRAKRLQELGAPPR